MKPVSYTHLDVYKRQELIGPQVEMYNERARQYPIDMGNAHAYKRLMKVKIPEGYKVSGLALSLIHI